MTREASRKGEVEDKASTDGGCFPDVSPKYAEITAKARSKITLEDLGIDDFKARRSSES